jgi:hypothetical protein
VSVNSDSSAIFNPLEKDFIIIEELRDDNVSTGINLLFEILDVIFSTSSLRMNFWISRNDNTEIVPIILSNPSYKIRSMMESIFNSFPSLMTTRWISS